MELETVEHSLLGVNTPGRFPFVCKEWPKKPLFIIEGEFKKEGPLFLMLHGKAYRYEDFHWPEEKKVEVLTCREIAEKTMTACASSG